MMIPSSIAHRARGRRRRDRNWFVLVAMILNLAGQALSLRANRRRLRDLDSR
jgi:hypothetical protein